MPRRRSEAQVVASRSRPAPAGPGLGDALVGRVVAALRLVPDRRAKSYSTDSRPRPAFTGSLRPVDHERPPQVAGSSPCLHAGDKRRAAYQVATALGCSPSGGAPGVATTPRGAS